METHASEKEKVSSQMGCIWLHSIQHHQYHSWTDQQLAEELWTGEKGIGQGYMWGLRANSGESPAPQGRCDMPHQL